MENLFAIDVFYEKVKPEHFLDLRIEQFQKTERQISHPIFAHCCNSFSSMLGTNDYSSSMEVPPYIGHRMDQKRRGGDFFFYQCPMSPLICTHKAPLGRHINDKIMHAFNAPSSTTLILNLYRDVV